MKINVGDKVGYEDTYAAGIKMVTAGIGKVVELKPDVYGKSNKQIAVIKQRGHESFEMFTNGLEVVDR
ncbi:hypothetical protein AZI11_08360 [Levilactobacillus brevis]|uniref:hypothetical protein n=1 Tax=Levilactobacillus brevis TaxID=1580 RepID=UPI000A203173|nr:hypothetical protein [Levilactobacillus brevis]ARN92913.1 hypothetical protein AZI11_08360 [Levilactobacillus brevis]ARN95557.1 hypothetical protein AZI12_08410 [Levilactobacillus brevis]MBS0978701.1 hypothetical protein [Levilactobacillus brevis]